MYPLSEQHSHKLLKKLGQLSWMSTQLTTLKMPATTPFCSSSSFSASEHEIKRKQQEVPQWLATLASLQHLHLNNSRMSAAGCLGLRAALFALSSLKSLHLRGNALGTQGIATLAPALQVQVK